MKAIYTLLILLIPFVGFCQLPNGSYTAPNFTVTDIEGNSHTLYEYLDDGYTVVLHFSAYWNQYDWNYLTSGNLQDLWTSHGPIGGPAVSYNTTGDIMILWVDCFAPTLDFLENSSFGNFLEPLGNQIYFPQIINYNLDSIYGINAFPSIFTICPNRSVINIYSSEFENEIYSSLDNCGFTEIYGCIDEMACNYNHLANTNDSSCFFPVNIEETYSACNEFNWNGELYTQSGEYNYVTLGSNGCDSITTLNLTITNSINVNLDITYCDEYLWQGEVYTESGTYTYETVNENGCDSIINLNLSIVDGLESQNIIGQDEVEPFTQHIYALVLNGNNYSWSVTNGNILSDNGNNIEVLWGEAGIGLFEVVETDENGCMITHSLQVNIGYNVENSWNCVNDACVDPLDGSGAYSSINDCEANCSVVIEDSWNCLNDACVDPMDGSGVYNTLDACEANCTVLVEDSWNCINDACVDPMDGSGNFQSLEECEANCSVVVEDSWNCVNDACVDPMDGSGVYNTLDACEANCSVVVEDSWNCVNDACVDPMDGSGLYNTLDACEANCNATSIVETNLDINIYPNPSTNIFNLEFYSDTETEILVTNVLGEKVYFEAIKTLAELNTQIDLSNEPKGLYNLTIKTSDGISNHKLILQ